MVKNRSLDPLRPQPEARNRVSFLQISVFLLFPDAVQHEALAEWCSAEPGSFHTPSLERSRVCSAPLRSAALAREKSGGRDLLLFPDAVQHEALKGVYARLRGLCGAVLRRAGIVPHSEPGTIPGQQRTTKKCCAAPGKRPQAETSCFSRTRCGA